MTSDDPTTNYIEAVKLYRDGKITTEQVIYVANVMRESFSMQPVSSVDELPELRGQKPAEPPPVIRPVQRQAAPDIAAGPQQPIIVQAGLKNRGTALVLEIVPALFGFFGIGWIYAGEAGNGLILMFGMFIWTAIQTALAIVTGTSSLCITIPITVLVLIISAASLSSFAEKHTERFTRY